MDSPAETQYTALPGTEGTPAPPTDEISRVRVVRGVNYRPHAKHLRPDGWAKYTNRLFLESSPYLLQHAHNPVNWFPWGDEAFLLARQLDRPLLVSIGYATCHWCHVMEEESFEDEEIAAFLNSKFIAIKVDREERPDIDAIYMNALHAMKVQGGWPLNVWLTPEGRPFYGGTYFPPANNSRGVGFLPLLKAIRDAYDGRRAEIMATADQVASAVRYIATPAGGEDLPQLTIVDAAIEACEANFDAVNGGTLGAPKFPSSLPIRLLLRQYRRTKDHNLLHMANLTLQRMAAGGIYDQVGGGFHRYATDERWLIPHFEKMLYDNALLAVTYLEAYQITRDGNLSRAARDTLTYITKDAASPQGGFYCASDADSLTPSGRREEGYYFTWPLQELLEVLGPERGKIIATCFGVTEKGNFEGRSVLHLPRPLSQVAGDLHIPAQELHTIVQEAKDVLYQARNRRPRPLQDSKILSSWNGLAISAFAKGGFLLEDALFTEKAHRAAEFLLEHMRTGGRLAHSYQEGAAKGEGFLDDYAFLIAGLLDLFETGAGIVWLERALQLAAVVVRDFEDAENGGFYLTSVNHERLIAREKPIYDAAIPSGNSVMIMDLLRLCRLTGDTGWKRHAERALRNFSIVMEANPLAAAEMLLAVDYFSGDETQIVIVAPEGNRAAAEALLHPVRESFLPHAMIVTLCEGEELQRAEKLIPVTRGKKALKDRAVAYLCENRTCLAPTSDPQEFALQLAAAAARPQQ